MVAAMSSGATHTFNNSSCRGVRTSIAIQEEKDDAEEIQTPTPEGPKRDAGKQESAQQLMVPTSFEMLSQPDIWICDMGTSSHSTNDKSGAVNERNNGSASLGHA